MMRGGSVYVTLNVCLNNFTTTPCTIKPHPPGMLMTVLPNLALRVIERTLGSFILNRGDKLINDKNLVDDTWMVKCHRDPFVTEGWEGFLKGPLLKGLMRSWKVRGES